MAPTPVFIRLESTINIVETSTGLRKMLSSFFPNASTLLRGKRRGVKVLCHFNHFFGKGSDFVGKSTIGVSGDRSEIVKMALARIRALPVDVVVRVCGFPQFSLLPVDLDLSYIGEPRHLVYASIERMFDALNDYDFFLNIEDDILVADEVIETCIAFNSFSDLNEVYLPNRMERRADGSLYCVDLVAMPGWNESLHRDFQNTTLGIAYNPHSALSFLSQQQMDYAAKRVNLSRREIVVGGFMASAYANLHAPFLLWRARSNVLAHHVIHLDNWLLSPSQGDASPRPSLSASRDAPGRREATGCQPLGYVDSVVLEGTFVKCRGWAITETGHPAKEFLLEIDHHEIASEDCQLTRIERPDVVSAHPQAQPACGFEFAFPVSTLFPLQKAQETPVTLGFRAECGGTLSIIQGGVMAQALQSILAALPEIPSEPLMPQPVAERLMELMRQAKCYLEYGTGGTTVQAMELGIPAIFAVESDPLWLEAVRYRTSQIASASECEFIGVDIGPTSEWGYPTSETHWRSYTKYALDVWAACRAKNVSPDLILIDGRFRLACLLASILYGKPGCRILVDDYFARPYYAEVEQVILPARIIDRAAEFIIPDQILRDQVWQLLLAAVADPR